MLSEQAGAAWYRHVGGGSAKVTVVFWVVHPGFLPPGPLTHPSQLPRPQDSTLVTAGP